ncbi:MAG: FecR family protein [Janthinobacterium lividum]
MNATLLEWSDLANLPAMEVAALFVERGQRDDAPDDSLLLDRWLAASGQNREAWSRVRDAWDIFGSAGEMEEISGIRAAALSYRARPPSQRPAWLTYAIAASVVGCIGSLTVVKLRHAPSPGGGGTQLATVAGGAMTRFGQPDFTTGARAANYALPDGSRVTLDANSAVDVAYAGGFRLARVVRGGAAFDVRHDARSAFRVAIGDRVVSDIGTYFITRLAENQVRVSVIRGSVAVVSGTDPHTAATNAAVIVHGGQEFIASPGQPGRLQPIITPAAPAMVTFSDERLADAVTRMNQYTDDKLLVLDPKLSALRVSGSFKTGDMAAFGRALSALFPVRIEAVSAHRARVVRARNNG